MPFFSSTPKTPPPSPMEVTFYGVRGSIACPGSDYLRYGGNTPCVEVMAGNERIILDAGTGLRVLGNRMMKNAPCQATLLLSHTHWDHINGFPFFSPAFQKNFEFDVFAGHLDAPHNIRNVLSGQMVNPFFPVPIDHMDAQLSFHDFRAGETIELTSGLKIRTAPLNHPGGATAYRIDSGGVSMCYVTDMEHVPGRPNEALLELVQGTDLMVYDATYTDEELPKYVGWGHSTWQEGIRLSHEAGVKQLALFHHNHERNDTAMDAIDAAARATWKNAFVSREGQTVKLGG